MRSLKLCTWTFSEPEWLRIIASPSAALPPGLCGGPDLVIASHRLSVQLAATRSAYRRPRPSRHLVRNYAKRRAMNPPECCGFSSLC